MTCGIYYTLFLNTTECTQGQMTQSVISKQFLQKCYLILSHINGPEEKKIKKR